MRFKYALLVAAMLLAGCSKPSVSDDPLPPPATNHAGVVYDNETPVLKVGVVNGNPIWKFCDGRNLVYVGDAYSGNSIAVVGNAQECTG